MTYNQQERLYEAEATVGRGREFASIEEVRRFVTELSETDWWRRGYSKVLHVEARLLEETATASVGGWREELGAGAIDIHPRWMCERTVCHELAHVLAGARFGSHAHDPWFCRVYLELLGLASPERYMELFTAFLRVSVDFRCDTRTGDAIPMERATI